MKYCQIYSLILFNFFLFTAQAQLVNIEAKRMQTDSTRFMLKSDLLANYSDNNDEYVLRIRSNISTQLKSKNLKEIYFLVLSYNLVRTQGKDFQNSWFVHVISYQTFFVWKRSYKTRIIHNSPYQEENSLVRESVSN